MTRCISCGRLPTEEHCAECHRAAEISTWGPRRGPKPPPAPQVLGPTLEDFDADRFRKRRIAAGLTQQELSRRTGVSVSSISDWERGASPPRWEKYHRIDEWLEEFEGGAA